MATVTATSTQNKTGTYLIEYWCRQYKIMMPEYLMKVLISFLIIDIGFVADDNKILQVATMLPSDYDEHIDDIYEYAYTNNFINFNDPAIKIYKITFKIVSSATFIINDQIVYNIGEFFIGICRHNENENQHSTEISSYLHDQHIHLGKGIYIIIYYIYIQDSL